jgi:hypothetical protein
MKISELIARLEKLKQEHGDEEVRIIADPNSPSRKNPFFKMKEHEISHGNISKIEAGYIVLKPEYFPEVQKNKFKIIFIYAE